MLPSEIVAEGGREYHVSLVPEIGDAAPFLVPKSQRVGTRNPFNPVPISKRLMAMPLHRFSREKRGFRFPSVCAA